MRRLRASTERAHLEDFLDERADGADPLAQLLGAARGGASIEETAGLTAALAVFTTSTPPPTSTTLTRNSAKHTRPGRPGSMVKSLAAATFATKVLTGLAVATAAAGITVIAVSAGHPTHPPQAAVSSGAPTGHTPPGTAARSAATGRPSVSTSPSRGGSSATRPPSLRAKDKHNPDD
jgi:hypothetical protein